MTATFGFQPLYLTVHLTDGGDFIQELLTSDGSPWADGTSIVLEFGTDPVTEWAATISGSTASWNVDKAVVAALGVGVKRTARVIYTNGAGADVPWFIGNTVWHGVNG